ncbi:hypothetical protein JHK82_020025 [Glycine max]|nr:hypothetical protein JHK85_020477 [Glycine max]KAG5024133.1 hypothetical protein JHK86_020047 [Glycine max]KAG5135294.1 hypothetical protein JHK82_020025 [Glycine max]
MNYYPPFPIPELTVGVGRHSDFGTIILCIFTNIIKLGEGLLKEPEDVGVDKEQILYTATRDGWIKRLRRNNGKWENWKHIDSHTLLVIATAKEGGLIVCDTSKVK